VSRRQEGVTQARRSADCQVRHGAASSRFVCQHVLPAAKWPFDLHRLVRSPRSRLLKAASWLFSASRACLFCLFAKFATVSSP